MINLLFGLVVVYLGLSIMTGFWGAFVILSSAVLVLLGVAFIVTEIQRQL